MRQFRFPNGDHVPKCKIPSLEGFQGEHTRAVKGDKSLQKSESVTVWRYYHVFVPTGEGNISLILSNGMELSAKNFIGMCPRHQAAFQLKMLNLFSQQEQMLMAVLVLLMSIKLLAEKSVVTIFALFVINIVNHFTNHHIRILTSEACCEKRCANLAAATTHLQIHRL